MRSRQLAVVLVVLAAMLIGCGGSGGDGQAVAAPSASDPRVTGISAEMLAAINTVRATAQTCGVTVMPAVQPISWNDKLAVAALRHTQDMVIHRNLSHTGSDGSSAGTRVTQAGYAYRYVGENIAVGQTTVTAVIQSWMNSEVHCKNIMSSSYTEIGAAADIGTHQNFSNMRYWTLNLASP